MCIYINICVYYIYIVASREIETTGFDPASQFLSNISRRA